jgi:ATP-dependent helicase/nuclease subunit B
MPRRTEQPYLPFDTPTEPAEPTPAPSAGVAPPSARLLDSLARACREHLLDEKVLVAPSLAIGHTLVERLAREGHPWIHLRVETVRTIALGIVGPQLSREGLRLLSRAQALALIEQACAESLRRKSYFGELRDRPGFHRALQRTFEEIRAAGLSGTALPARAFDDARKAKELQGILARYDQDLAGGRFIDSAAVLRRALQAAAPDPGGVRYLVVDEAELTAVERELLDKVSGGRLEVLASEDPDRWMDNASTARLLRASGEENEIRDVFRHVLENGIPFDQVEILHTDPSTYPALAFELAREHGIDCTFSGGVAAAFTHPGQAALAFLDWIAAGFEADILRRSLASGALTFERVPDRARDAPGTRAVARALREAQIGWGASRHRTALDRRITELEKPDERGRESDDDGERELAERAERRRRRLHEAREARAFAVRVLELAECADTAGQAGGAGRPPSASLAGGAGRPPSPPGCDLRAVARGCRDFVREYARVADAMDASALTALEKLLEELEVLPATKLAPSEAAARLSDAVRALSIDADRARPGRVHVADYRAGGFSGRSHTFLLGLDDARHPGADLEDPVLLDAERRQINRLLAPIALPLYRDRPRESARALSKCVARLQGNLTASYSSWNLRSLDQQSEQFPSPFFLELYRARSGRPEADYSTLLGALPEAAGFLPGIGAALDETEWWLSRLEAAGPAGAAGAAAPGVLEVYPHLAEGRRAEEARASEEFTVWDGWVQPGTPELDPRTSGEPQSASRLETLAQCPFKYFLKHVLRVEPPKELERDPTEWLDAMTAGSLLHEVFRQFFERITAAGEKPAVGRHAALLEEIAAEQIGVWREKVPPASELAFGQRRDDILLACRTFLALEEEHCREVTPRWFEVPFGLARAEGRGGISSREPVPISLGGKSFALRGSIDRVDEAPDGSFHVWDYKTGGTWRHKEKRGIHGGRQIQHALYAMALEVLLGRAGLTGHVSRSGYFFPGRKGEGQRMRMTLDLGETREVLGRLLDLLRAGAFPHAPEKDDCRYCDYETVCGGPWTAGPRSKEKLARTTLPELRAFREIHGAG